LPGNHFLACGITQILNLQELACPVDNQDKGYGPKGKPQRGNYLIHDLSANVHSIRLKPAKSLSYPLSV